jgi:hypothetical protein
MPRRRTYSAYSSYYGREKQRRLPSPLPYLVIALVAGAGLAYFHLVEFKSIQGKVSNAYTGAPMQGVAISVQTASTSPSAATDGMSTPGATPLVLSASILTATTAADGVFAIERLPPDPVLSVAMDGFASQTMPVAGKGSVDIKLVPNVLTGRVVAVDGNPVVGASVWAGTARTLTGADGGYVLKDIPEERRLVVKAPGYISNEVQFGLVVTQNVTLEPFVARAVYLNPDTIATPGKLQQLLDMVDRTELSAVVIDVKADNSGLVLYDSKLPDVQTMGVVNRLIPDLSGLLAMLEAKKIYTIARLPVFWDQAATAAKPEWALKSKKAPGQPWLDASGTRWANPYMAEVWDYNIALAKEVAQRGFSEVQFDFAQFPSDGDLDDIDFGPAQAGRRRVEAIGGFLDKAYSELSPLGVYVGCNLLASSALDEGDIGIGQDMKMVASHVDYVCPTIYPAYFGSGYFGFPKPVEHPGDVVAQTLKAGAARVAGTGARIRPWLQDFSVRMQYDAPHVRAQIDAAEQNGALGWMLWNFGNVYTAGALKGP